MNKKKSQIDQSIQAAEYNENPGSDQVRGSSQSRRAFIGTVAAGVAALPPILSSTGEARAQEFEIEAAVTGKKRAKQAQNLRIDAANIQRAVPIPDHVENGDRKSVV